MSGLKPVSSESSPCFCYPVVPKKDGSTYRWERVTLKKRAKLGLQDRSLRPHTAKVGITKGGIAVQLSQPNFVDELLDLRLMTHNARMGKPLDTEADPDLLADVTQEIAYQLSGGSVSMTTGSRIYVYGRDRCAISEEHMRWNGWGDDIQLDCMLEDPIAKKRLEVSGSLTKRSRRGRKGQYHAKARKAAGNAECLSDLASVVVPLIWLLNCDIFANKISMADLPDIGADIGKHDPVVVLDPNLPQRELKRMEKQAMNLNVVDSDDEIDEDQDQVDDFDGDTD